MSERGVFSVARAVFDHPAFADEPFTEREAWMWLISAAAYKPHRRRVGSVEASLERGQLAASVRFLAERWKWSKSRVDRFLGRLKKRDMIATDSGTGVLVITICNYCSYQFGGKPSGTPQSEESGTAAGQQRDKLEEGKKVIHLTLVADATKAADAASDPTAPERDLFRRGKEVLGSDAGGLITKLKNIRGGNVALARADIERASQAENPRQYVGGILNSHGKPKKGLTYDVRSNWLDALQSPREGESGCISASYEVLGEPECSSSLARVGNCR